MYAGSATPYAPYKSGEGTASCAPTQRFTVPPKPRLNMYGPYLFKRGFGGTLRRWVGAHDAVPRSLAYRAYLLAEPAYTAALRLAGRLRG